MALAMDAHSVTVCSLYFRVLLFAGDGGHAGVYPAKEGQTSMGHYAAGGRACVRGKPGPTSCVVLAEFVSLRHKFRQCSLYAFGWYLLIKGLEAPGLTETCLFAQFVPPSPPAAKIGAHSAVPDVDICAPGLSSQPPRSCTERLPSSQMRTPVIGCPTLIPRLPLPEQHPLLTEELLRIKVPLQNEVPAFQNRLTGSAVEQDDGVDAFGSLSNNFFDTRK
ncbi:hypothetical protein B0H19DRAFT_1271691 [Mycena capillaripes]|nr:hypothetical protein B0H19DRAFT_1271691 [Mycena capillaripes]